MVINCMGLPDLNSRHIDAVLERNAAARRRGGASPRCWPSRRPLRPSGAACSRDVRALAPAVARPATATRTRGP
eukprot:7759637-Pyramimonas_sp.AAC.1